MPMTTQDAQNYLGKLVVLTMADGRQASGTIVQVMSDSFTFQAYPNNKPAVQIPFSEIQSIAQMTFQTSGLTADQLQPFVGHQVGVVFTSSSGSQIRAVGTLISVDAVNGILSVNGAVNGIPLANMWSVEDLGVPAKATVASAVASFANSGWGKALILSAVGVGGWLVGKNWDEWIGAEGIEPEEGEAGQEEIEGSESEGEEAPDDEGKED